MPYTPYQDGTQLFGIPESPLTINSVAYILESWNVDLPSTRVEIKDQNGIVIGQEFVPGVPNARAKLQFATVSTVPPARNQTFSADGQVWIVDTVGNVYTQGAYAYCNITAYAKIN